MKKLIFVISLSLISQAAFSKDSIKVRAGEGDDCSQLCGWQGSSASGVMTNGKCVCTYPELRKPKLDIKTK